jgi:hypothetical protein
MPRPPADAPIKADALIEEKNSSINHDGHGVDELLSAGEAPAAQHLYIIINAIIISNLAVTAILIEHRGLLVD